MYCIGECRNVFFGIGKFKSFVDDFRLGYFYFNIDFYVLLYIIDMFVLFVF